MDCLVGTWAPGLHLEIYIYIYYILGKILFIQSCWKKLQNQLTININKHVYNFILQTELKMKMLQKKSSTKPLFFFSREIFECA